MWLRDSVSKVKPTRHFAAAGVGTIAVAVLAGCTLVQGPADRTDEFVAAGRDCTGSWWLGELREGIDPEAKAVAGTALAAAEVTADHRAAATRLLDLSQSDAERERTSAVDLESEAYMLAVTLQVKEALDAAGYPDADRVMEIWSERDCG